MQKDLRHVADVRASAMCKPKKSYDGKKLGRKLELRWESELVGSELDHEKALVVGVSAR